MSHLRLSEDEFNRLQAKARPPLVLNRAPDTYMDGTPVREIPPLPSKTTPAKVRPGKAKSGSKIEEMLAQQIAILRLPEPVREYRHIPGRKFRLDFAWPLLTPPIGVEVQGQVHRIKARFEADILKRRLGLMAGWRILEVSGKTIRSGDAVQWVAELIMGRVDTPVTRHPINLTGEDCK